MTGPTVTARGDAVASATPDEGIWTIEVMALDPSADDALATVTRQTSELAALLDEMDVNRRSVRQLA